MTPDICDPWPLSFHDNMADAQEKMQMHSVRSKHPTMKWEMGNVVTVGDNDRTGSSDRQERHREGLPLGTDLLCPPNTIVSLSILGTKFQGRGSCVKCGFRFWLMGSQWWNYQDPQGGIHKDYTTTEIFLGNRWHLKQDYKPQGICT